MYERWYNSLIFNRSYFCSMSMVDHRSVAATLSSTRWADRLDTVRTPIGSTTTTRNRLQGLVQEFAWSRPTGWAVVQNRGEQHIIKPKLTELPINMFLGYQVARSRRPNEPMSDTEKRHYCKCGKSYKFRKHLNFHMKWECGKSLICDLCSKTFTLRGSYLEHMRQHHNWNTSFGWWWVVGSSPDRVDRVWLLFCRAPNKPECSTKIF